jgi:hypothetical protein
MRIPEIEVALPVTLWLRDLGWDTYEEVTGPAGRADIVATRGRLIWVIEAKSAIGLQVIGQAQRWCLYAHYVSIAVPPHKHGHIYTDADAVAKRILNIWGIGIFRAQMCTSPGIIAKEPKINEDVRPSLRRRVDDHVLRSMLHDEQRTIGKAGTQHGYWTPFRQTCDNLRHYLRDHDGASLKDAILSISTHYRTPSSAIGALHDLIHSGIVEGVKLVDGHLYLRDGQ